MAMKYTLFIDESGDFDKAPRWIVSGVLCEGNPEQAEKKLKDALFHIPRQFNLSSCSDLHLTALRSRLGIEEANNVARTVFSAAEDTGIVIAMLVVENFRKKGLRESERTYRLMLLDLLALADTALPDGKEDQQLEVVVARRQKQGQLMSTRDELLADVVDQIKDAVEAGLAARGLLDRLDSHHVQIIPAAKSFGLVVADFVANLSYNRHHRESVELFNTLELDGQIRVFEGLGGYAERRARIAERDGDLVSALARWSAIAPDKVSKDLQHNSLVRIWQRSMSRGSTGPIATLEAVLEKLWRHYKEPSFYPDLLDQFCRLESSLIEAEGRSHLIYRLRNFMHMIANQIGDLSTSDRIVKHQAEMAEFIASDPSLFHLILDNQLLRTVTEEVKLRFKTAIEVARSHCDLVERYRAVWELLVVDSRENGFTNSRLWLKARMALLRTLLLAGGDENLRDAQELINSLSARNLNYSDMARLSNYQIWADIRSGQLGSAINRSRTILDSDISIFATQFVVRAAADVVIEGQNVFFDDVRTMLPLLRQRVQNISGHPADLIWRDMGVIELHLGRGKKVAIRRLKQSVEITRSLPSSPVKSWIYHVTKMHLAEIAAEVSVNDEILLEEGAALLLNQVNRLAQQIGLLRAYRKVSPY